MIRLFASRQESDERVMVDWSVAFCTAAVEECIAYILGDIDKAKRGTYQEHAMGSPKGRWVDYEVRVSRHGQTGEVLRVWTARQGRAFVRNGSLHARLWKARAKG